MPRRLNVRLLLWTAGVVLTVCVCAHLLHGVQQRGNAGALLRQAERAVEEGHVGKAVTYYRHYLVYEPDDPAALAAYARALDRLPFSPTTRLQTFLVMEQAVRRDPTRHDLRERLVRLAINMRRFADAERHLEGLATALPARGDVEHQLGWCQEARGNYPAAAASFARAIKKAPMQLESYVLLAELLQRQLDQPEEAARVLDQMVEANPKSHKALLARARRHRERGALDAALADARRAADLAPKEADVLLTVADVARDRDEPATAREALKRGLELHPRDERFYRTLAALELESGRRAEAVACLRRGLAAVPEGGLAPQLADLLLDEGNLDEATALAARVRKAGDMGTADYLEGRALAARGRWLEALDRLEAARARFGWSGHSVTGAARVEVWLGKCHEQEGDTDLRLAAFRRAVALDPALPVARLGLAAALLDSGASEEGLAEARRLTTGTPPPGAWAVLARALARRDGNSARAALERAAKENPNAPEVTLLRAEVLEGQGDGEGALALLREAVEARPKDARFWATLADVTRRAGDASEAAEVLEQAHKSAGDSIDLRLARVRQAGEARAELERLAQEARGGLRPAEQARLLRRLAEALQQAGAVESAGQAWREVATLRPKDLSSRLMRFDLALRSGHDQECDAILGEIRAVEGEEGVVWRVAEAGRLVAKATHGDRSGLGAARQRVAEAKKRHPDWTRVPLLEAALDELEGQFDSAAGHYQRAVDLGERRLAVLVRLARLHYQSGRYVEAGRTLRLLEEQGPLTRDQARLAADIALVQRDHRRALALGRQAVTTDARDYRDHLWLAHVQSAAGQEGDAEDTLRRAVQVGANIPDPWVALVRHLTRTGKRDQAEEVLREATRKLPESRSPLPLARCNEALGHLKRAEAFYREALKARPHDLVALRATADFLLRQDRFREAEPHLRRLLDPATRAPAEYVAQARRLLAVELAARDARKGTEALALVEENTRRHGSSAEDERARAFVLATQPARRAEALRLLRELADRQPLPPEGQFLLARGFEAAGDDLRARDLLLGLAATHGDVSSYLTLQVRILIRQGDLDDAETALSRLERLEPEGTRARGLRAALSQARTEKR